MPRFVGAIEDLLPGAPLQRTEVKYGLSWLHSYVHDWHCQVGAGWVVRLSACFLLLFQVPSTPTWISGLAGNQASSHGALGGELSIVFAAQAIDGFHTLMQVYHPSPLSLPLSPSSAPPPPRPPPCSWHRSCTVPASWSTWGTLMGRRLSGSLA